MQKPILQVLNGKVGDKVPFWFMRQAGRYLPEYRELRKEKSGFLNTVYDPKAACEVTLQPIRRFGMDAAILFSDILVIPQALGQHLEFVQGEGPKLHSVENANDLKKLNDKNLHEILGPVYETVANVRKGLVQENFETVALIGFAGSPWTVATYMIEGGSSRDFLKTKIMAYQNPELFQNLIDKVVSATSEYLIKQIEAGAEVIQLFDSWCEILDEEQFERWVIAPTKTIVEKIHVKHPNIPVIGFPKGAGVKSAYYANKTGIQAIGVDAQTPVSWVAKNLQNALPVQGNLDPLSLFAGGEQLERSVDNILQTLSKGPFIFNLGHGIHKDTPIKHVELVVKKIKDFCP